MRRLFHIRSCDGRRVTVGYAEAGIHTGRQGVQNRFVMIGLVLSSTILTIRLRAAAVGRCVRPSVHGDVVV